MIQHIKTWWAAHVTWVGAAAAFLDPSVKAWLSQHPGYAAAGVVWMFILHLLPSPVKK
jgi:hypothetical protein